MIASMLIWQETLHCSPVWVVTVIPVKKAKLSVCCFHDFFPVKWNLNDESTHYKLNILENTATAFVFVIVVVNVFITAFGVQQPPPSAWTKPFFMMPDDHLSQNGPLCDFLHTWTRHSFTKGSWKICRCICSVIRPTRLEETRHSLRIKWHCLLCKSWMDEPNVVFSCMCVRGFLSPTMPLNNLLMFSFYFIRQLPPIMLRLLMQIT